MPSVALIGIPSSINPGPAVLEQRYAYHVREPLNVEAMNQASAYLLGSQDFASFGKPPQGQVTIRNVIKAEWLKNDTQLIFEITANAFLYRMVRKIVGTLLKVGLGQLRQDEIPHIIAAKDLTKSAVPAPACGLCLSQVGYPHALWSDDN